MRIFRTVAAVSPILLAGLVAAAMLAGCNDRRDYPLLGQRPIEREPSALPPSPPPAAPTDVARNARAAALAELARQGDAGFVRLAEATCDNIARGLGAGQGSEAWIAAQQALSSLQAARGPVQSAAAELDRLMTDSGGASGEPIESSRIAEQQAQVSALDTAEQIRLEAVVAGRCGA